MTTTRQSNAYSIMITVIIIIISIQYNRFIYVIQHLRRRLRNSIPCDTYQNRVQLSAVVQTLFFHSTCRYHLHTCRPQSYSECDWNGAVLQQTKKLFVWKIIIIIIIMMKILPVLLLSGSLPLKRISSCLQDVVSHKSTRSQKVCVY